MTEDNHAIGIDLGTTYSCVAAWQADHVEILVNDHGNRTTRSYVTFTDSKRLVGDEAFNQVGRFPANSIFGEFTLHGIPPAPRGVPKFTVYFDMDANGVLSVSAEDMSTRQKKGIKIKRDRTK
ncbi:hypothetical protein L3X38_038702 [Prunus dulcis]|uniref:Uncharacterized protein n=1 Tax=Prunus dulcis TaxID=3755 RepID=A0AAD4V6Z4_PRUDU|nr:hypothetical protein L3X38_038702 [Prunus dulcis]